MTDLAAVAREAIEKAFKDEVKAHFHMLCTNSLGDAKSDDAALNGFRGGMLQLVKLRAQALFVIDKVVL